MCCIHMKTCTNFPNMQVFIKHLQKITLYTMPFARGLPPVCKSAGFCRPFPGERAFFRPGAAGRFAQGASGATMAPPGCTGMGAPGGGLEWPWQGALKIYGILTKPRAPGAPGGRLSGAFARRHGPRLSRRRALPRGYSPSASKRSSPFFRGARLSPWRTRDMVSRARATAPPA